jgi:hypothetical protein
MTDPSPPPGNHVDVSVDKDIDVDISFDLSSNVDITLNKDVDIDVRVYSNADVHGNVALATFSAEAIGNNSFSEADVHVLATDGLSSVDGTLQAAVS